MGITLPTIRRGAGNVTAKNDQAGAFIQLITASIVLIVGVLIFNEIYDSLPETSGGINDTVIVGDITTAMELAPIVLLVIVASLVLLQVSGFGRMR
jgi:hypothetical protein